MFELTIGGKVYQFRFGMGFMRDINKKKSRPIDGMPGEKQDVGLQFAIASLIDEDPVALVDVLEVANKTESPRVSRAMLDNYIDEECTDIGALFSEVLDFLKQANATKKVATAVVEMVEAEKAKAAAQK